MPNSSDGAVFRAQAGEDWLNPNGIRSKYNVFESFCYLYLCIQHFVVDLHQETKQKQNVMKNHTISNITYKIVIVEYVSINTHTMTFERLFFNDKEDGEDWEFVYALGEISEDVMKLEIGQNLCFNANRDIESFKGIIVRVN
jgi:hypothetical protein